MAQGDTVITALWPMHAQTIKEPLFTQEGLFYWGRHQHAKGRYRADVGREPDRMNPAW